LPVALMIAAGRESPPVTVPGHLARISTVVLALAAVALFLHPTFQALRIAQTLPEQLTKAFGGPPPARPPFSLAGLIDSGPAAAAHRSFVFAGAGTPAALSLDFYPASRPGPAPCVVVIHGGGWDSGNRGQFASFSRHLAAEGYAVADIDYRLAPAFRWPAQRDDVLAALAFLKSHPDLGVDPARLVLFGRSAGGQIAEAVAYGQSDPAIRGVIAFYAPSDLEYSWDHIQAGDTLDTRALLTRFLGGSPGHAKSNYRTSSGCELVGRSSPPTLLVHGRLDTLVRAWQSQRLADRCARFGRPCLVVELPWATHACDFNRAGPSGQLSGYAVERFLAAVTK
jgi:acetyl esterase/lipase